jgi:predicted MFS family arabinose efflux permease
MTWFARLWVAAFCSETAEWMLQVALPVAVYQATGSATSTAAMMVLGLVPAVVLSPAAGVLADRVDRGRLLRWIALGQALVAAPLLALDQATWLAAVVMAAQAGLAALFEPARNALLPQVVGPERVTAANGMLATAATIARLAGAWLGGLLFATGGTAAVYVGYAGVLAVAVLALSARFGGRPQRTETAHALREWLDGLVMVRRDRRLWVAGGAMLLAGIAQGMFLVLFVTFVLDGLRGDAGTIGLLRGIQAVGGLAAGLGLAGLARRAAPSRLLGWGGLLSGVLSAVIWNSPNLTTGLGVYIGLFALAGAPGVVANSGLMSVLQTSVPPAATGRLISSAVAVIALGTAVGMLVAGVCVDVVGTTALLNAQATLYVLAGLLVLAVRPRSARHVPDAAVAEQASR